MKVSGAADDEAGVAMLRCFFGDSEAGVFRWDEVAGYSLDAPASHNGASTREAYEPWGARQ